MNNNFDNKKEKAVLCGLAAACFEKGESSDEVSMGELAALVEKVQSGEIKYCPHGRPVAVKLTAYEIEKMFKRA